MRLQIELKKIMTLPMKYVKPRGGTGMSNNGNNNGGKMGDKSNETAPTNRRGNGKMKHQLHSLEGLTMPKQQEFIRIRQFVENLPELRMDRISKLAKAIDDGTYHVSSKKIAEAIFQKNFHDGPR